MSAFARSDLIDLTVGLEFESPKAVRVNDGIKTAWLPLSQIEIERDQPKPGFAKITLPEWLARDKGLI
jgi:hypothetical protein